VEETIKRKTTILVLDNT